MEPEPQSRDKYVMEPMPGHRAREQRAKGALSGRGGFAKPWRQSGKSKVVEAGR